MCITVSTENIGNGQTFTMAAEVGLLTRNIRVIGNDYNKLFEQSFGTRVIIGTVPGDTGDFVGKNISSFKLKFYTDF